jgi:hypothetical protein
MKSTVYFRAGESKFRMSATHLTHSANKTLRTSPYFFSLLFVLLRTFFLYFSYFSVLFWTFILQKYRRSAFSPLHFLLFDHYFDFWCKTCTSSFDYLHKAYCLFYNCFTRNKYIINHHSSDNYFISITHTWLHNKQYSSLLIFFLLTLGQLAHLKWLTSLSI